MRELKKAAQKKSIIFFKVYTNYYCDRKKHSEVNDPLISTSLFAYKHRNVNTTSIDHH